MNQETGERARWRAAYRAARLGNMVPLPYRYPDLFGVLYDAHEDRLRVCGLRKHALNRLRSFDPLWGVLRPRVIGGRDRAVGDDKRFNRWRVAVPCVRVEGCW